MTAFAYIDPSATSYLIQIVAGVVITAGTTVGIFVKKIKMSFGRRKWSIWNRVLRRMRKRTKSKMKMGMILNNLL